MHRLLSRHGHLPICLLLAALCLPAQAQDADEQVAGEGGRILRYSSTQTWSDMNDEERSQYQRLRDHSLNAPSLALALQACRDALFSLGYSRIDTDGEFNLIRAERDQKLIGSARAMLRGLLKLKTPLPAKPDHQTTEVLLILRPASQGPAIQLRARFKETVWDSNGDSHTKISSDAKTYQGFYQQLDATLAKARR